jgi:hypothetical protein
MHSSYASFFTKATKDKRASEDKHDIIKIDFQANLMSMFRVSEMLNGGLTNQKEDII